MEIRLATESDVPAICAITNDAIAGSAAHFATRPEPEGEVLRAWRDARARYPWLVAAEGHPREDGTHVTGFAKASAWNPRGAYDWTAEVTVYVRPAHQRRGIGRALYERLFEILRAQGYRTLLAGITLPNEASIALHERMGMRQVAAFERIGYKFARWRDVGYWQCHLADSDPPPRALRSVDLAVSAISDASGAPASPQRDHRRPAGP